jgi:hypothetical protein
MTFSVRDIIKQHAEAYQSDVIQIRKFVKEIAADGDELLDHHTSKRVRASDGAY